ncbi:uracil DNA glycosylase [Scheffersomyces spartinae]|uniref:Uracil-DNA glycosylase n=1 Tax=Scheffersomyces spartinae TaxID=45513 RepID=A0A9P8AJA8_9ASCO|nr:uracil DNA glycosylase [Scheffersomyces spartinae]KAG7194566.1 uracil DNA glycosylase [Scheffersomyces spartinae]
MTVSKRILDSAIDGGSKKPRLITDFFARSKEKTKSNTTESSIKSSTTEYNTESATTDNNTTKSTTKSDSDSDYNDFCAKHNFNKEEWINLLSEEERSLLSTEIDHLHISWLVFLHKRIRTPQFLELKRFLAHQKQAKITVFPPENQIYSWSHYTPVDKVKCLVLGQDPYHNFNQAHGLAFSVLEPTRPPPSLLNIYKTIKIDYPQFVIPDYKTIPGGGGGNLTQWAKRGVLMLNACLTVEAHKANSHAGKGWESFTEDVIKTAIEFHQDRQGFVIMAWGSPAQKRVGNFQRQLNANPNKFLVLKSVHPSPLSASRGFFTLKVFIRCNEWLEKQKKSKIDWGLMEGNVVE